MRIKHGTPEDRPKWTDRAKNPTRDTTREGTGSLVKRIVHEYEPESETNQESDTSDD